MFSGFVGSTATAVTTPVVGKLPSVWPLTTGAGPVACHCSGVVLALPAPPTIGDVIVMVGGGAALTTRTGSSGAAVNGEVVKVAVVKVPPNVVVTWWVCDTNPPPYLYGRCQVDHGKLIV